MLLILLVLIAAVLAYTLRGWLHQPDLSQYYAPHINLIPEYHTVSIPVEIAMKAGKQPFSKLFNIYGFSGNGPSIEQVVRANISVKNVAYDSEGDAFYVKAPDMETYLQVADELSSLHRLETLQSWLKNAAWILLKE